MHTQSDTRSGVGNELMSDAKDVGSSAVNRLHSEVDVRKGKAATQAKAVSTAIQSAAKDLDDTAPAWLKSAFEQGAQQVQKFADTLEQKDSRQLVSQVSEFARTSPGTFIAACAAAGFAAARIFKAGSSENTPTQPGPVGSENDFSSTGAPGAFGSPAGQTMPPQGQFA